MNVDIEQAAGHIVELKRTDPRHLAGSGKVAQDGRPAASPVESFGRLFMEALGNVNNAQLATMQLSQQMITDPESVNVHDLTIAMAEANLALSMTKAIVDKAVRAYQEIITLR